MTGMFKSVRTAEPPGPTFRRTFQALARRITSRASNLLAFDAGTCYLAVDGHRLDDLKPYLFVTSDYGATWTSIVNNLPAWGTVNVVREDTKNKDLLFVGTEFGLYVSLNGGSRMEDR